MHACVFSKERKKMLYPDKKDVEETCTSMERYYVSAKNDTYVGPLDTRVLTLKVHR